MSCGSDDEGSKIRAALNVTGDVVYVWDLAADRIEWFGPVDKLLQIPGPATVATGDTFNSRIHASDLKQRLRSLTRHFSTGTRLDTEFRIRGWDGRFHWIHELAAAEFDEATRKPLRVSGVLRGINSRKQAEERLEYLANYDDLTGHFNRTRLRDAVSHALSRCERFGQPGAYIVVDIDNIAMINDAYGFDAGDAVILGVAERLDQISGASDVIGRLHSDGFGVLLDNCGEEEATASAERIVRLIRERPLRTTTGDVSITVSAGGIVFPESAQTASDVMSRAEVALNKAKKAGRNCSAFYRLTEMERAGLRENMTVAKTVQAALAEQRITFAYQPIVDSVTGATAFYECLLRMRTPEGTILPAGRFIPVVEQLGLMRQIDRYTLELVVQELERDPDVVLAFNISGLTAGDPAWLRSMVAMLRGRPDLATRLIVEITETAALQELEESARFVGTLRDVGCRVALDDFGAGYSSFRHVKALPVDIVKIDGSYVRDVVNRTDHQLFIRTLLNLADGFGLTTVAECVETREEAELLAAEGVGFLQGWHLGKPQLTRAPVATFQTATPLAPAFDRAMIGKASAETASGMITERKI